MCQYLNLLTKLEAHRYVGQCEHGTLHLAWDHVTMHLSRADFLRLADILQTLPSDEESFIAKAASFSLSCDSHGGMYLWIGRTGLYLSLYDFLILSEMIYLSARLLISASAAKSPSSLNLGQYRLVVADEGISLQN
ncbi:MAG TPA: hypothetical protein VGL94_10470 [Ktedonobacteraceae bacterium]|jgi:hypothetical protein